MPTVEPLPAAWVLDLINGYGTQPRQAVGRGEQPYPALDRPFDLALPEPHQLAILADTLWRIFAEPRHDQRAEQLTRLLHRAKLDPVATPTGTLDWTSSRHDPVGRLTASAAVTLLSVVQLRGWDRLGICHGRDCDDAYVDDAGRARRIYCSPTCLNRARVRAHRARQHV